MTKRAMHDSAREQERFTTMPGALPRLRLHPIAAVLVFAIVYAFLYRLRGGGFGVNEWKPIHVHSRFIAWIPQMLLFIFAARCFARRP
jgi:hypothetical protein